MNLRQVEIFCAVMRCRTTIAAAYELGLSQPAVSNAIKHLEASVGFSLFDRIGNRLVPTREAKAVYRDTQPLQLMAQSIKRKVADLKDTKSGHLRVLSTPPFGETLIPRVIADFLRERENIQLFFDVRSMSGVIEAVESGFADIGVGLSASSRPGLDVKPFIQGKMVCALPHGHCLAQKSVIRPADLLDTPIIGLELHNPMGALTANAFHEKRIPYEPKIMVLKGATACLLVSQGIGVAIVDEFSASKAAGHHLVTRPFEPTIPVDGCVISVRDHPPSRLAKRFVDLLVAHAREADATPATAKRPVRR